MREKFIVITLLIFVFVPFIYAGNYGAGSYGAGIYGTATSGGATGGATTTTGGGGGASLQFDVKILEIDSSLTLGESFDFSYYVKGVGNFNRDVTLAFSLEDSGGDVISSGSDMIYFGINEEKDETASLFLPADINSGTYTLKVRASFGSVAGESHRTFTLTIEDGVAKVGQLLDISFSLEKAEIKNSDELIAITTFENFGSVPAKVNLTYSILDEQGNNIYSEEDNITVETTQVLRKSFKELNLSDGKYTFIMETLYGDGVYDKFQQDFEIRRFSIKDFYESYKHYIFAVAGLAIIFTLVIILIKKLKRRNKKKKISKKNIRRLRKKKSIFWKHKKRLNIMPHVIAFFKKHKRRKLKEKDSLREYEKNVRERLNKLEGKIPEKYKKRLFFIKKMKKKGEKKKNISAKKISNPTLKKLESDLARVSKEEDYLDREKMKLNAEKEEIRKKVTKEKEINKIMGMMLRLKDRIKNLRKK